MAVNKDVIEIHGYFTSCYKIGENGIYQSLKGYGRVCKPKKHDLGFKQSLISSKGCFPFVPCLDMDVGVSPANIELGEISSLAEVVDDVRHQWEGISIFDSEFVYLPVVLNKAELTIFLLNEEYRGGNQGLGGDNVPLV